MHLFSPHSLKLIKVLLHLGMMILLVKCIICVLLGVPNLKKILYVEGLLNNSKLHQCLVFHELVCCLNL